MTPAEIQVPQGKKGQAKTRKLLLDQGESSGSGANTGGKKVAGGDKVEGGDEVSGDNEVSDGNKDRK